MAFGCQAIYVFLVISQSSLESHLPPLFRSPTANAIENILFPVIKVKKKKNPTAIGTFYFFFFRVDDFLVNRLERWFSRVVSRQCTTITVFTGLNTRTTSALTNCLSTASQRLKIVNFSFRYIACAFHGWTLIAPVVVVWCHCCWKVELFMIRKKIRAFRITYGTLELSSSISFV